MIVYWKLIWIDCVLFLCLLQDFDGQGKAERLSRIIITLFGIVGLVWGFVVGQFSQTVFVLAAGVLLTLIVKFILIFVSNNFEKFVVLNFRSQYHHGQFIVANHWIGRNRKMSTAMIPRKRKNKFRLVRICVEKTLFSFPIDAKPFSKIAFILILSKCFWMWNLAGMAIKTK